MKKRNFLIILLPYVLLNATSVLLSMEKPSEKPVNLYIKYTEPISKYSIIPEVELISNPSIDFTKSSEELYAEIDLIFEANSTSSFSNHQPFLLNLYYYNEGRMPYKKMHLNPTQISEITKQQKNNHSIFMHGNTLKYIITNNAMSFIAEQKLFKLNFSPPTTIKKILEKIERSIILEGEVTKLKETLQEKMQFIENKQTNEQNENILRNKAANRTTIFFLLNNITIMIAFALVHDALRPLLFFIYLTNLLHFSTLI